MKKFAIIDSIGTWGYEKGKMVIDCAVKEYKLIEDGNDSAELWRKCLARDTEYHADGTWHHFSVYKRPMAKAILR